MMISCKGRGRIVAGQFCECEVRGHTEAMTAASLLPALDHRIAHDIVEDSIRTYFRKRRSRVPGFVERTFSLNAAAAVLRLAGRKQTADRLAARELFFRTTVTQEIERRLIVDLLELPYVG